jgi:hypothetical protein
MAAVPEPQAARPRLSPRRWWAFAAVALTYAVVAVWQIELPGVYMDAVNPDYLVVKILNPNAQPITAWVLSANYLDNLRLPVLIALYHGSLQFWLGLPLFWLFGTDVVGLRLTHAVFGLAVLASAFALLTRAGLKPWFAALACIALAIDPAFSYAFRTQSYITLAPAASLLFGLAAVMRAAAPETSHRHVWWFIGGVLYGISIFGYFIYLFFFPAIAYAVWTYRRPIEYATTRTPLAPIMAWGIGLALGLSGYWLGYGLIIQDRGSLAGFWQFIVEYPSTIRAFKFSMPIGARLVHAWEMLESDIHNWWHYVRLFGDVALVPGASAKTLLLVLLPLSLWGYAEWNRRATSALRVLVAMSFSFFAVALVFGNRMGGHHFIALLPVLYATLALGVRDAIAGGLGAPRAVMLLSPFVVLVGLNVGGQVMMGQKLAETRGVGLFSDAINRLAADLNAVERKPFVYFPDWGLSMPVAFLTRGTVGMDSNEDFAAARRMLCSGRDVALALINDDRRARIAAWQQRLRWAAPAIVEYRQGNGTIVFELATFRGQTGATDCDAN